MPNFGESQHLGVAAVLKENSEGGNLGFIEGSIFGVLFFAFSLLPIVCHFECGVGAQ